MIYNSIHVQPSSFTVEIDRKAGLPQDNDKYRTSVSSDQASDFCAEPRISFCISLYQYNCLSNMIDASFRTVVESKTIDIFQSVGSPNLAQISTNRGILPKIPGDPGRLSLPPRSSQSEVIYNLRKMKAQRHIVRPCAP